MIINGSKFRYIEDNIIEKLIKEKIQAKSPYFISGIKRSTSIFKIPRTYYKCGPSDLKGDINIKNENITSNKKNIKSKKFINVGQAGGRASQAIASSIFKTNSKIILAPSKTSLTFSRITSTTMFLLITLFGLLITSFLIFLSRSTLLLLINIPIFLFLIIRIGFNTYINYKAYLYSAPLSAIIKVNKKEKTIEINGTFSRINLPSAKMKLEGNLFVGDNISKF